MGFRQSIGMGPIWFAAFMLLALLIAPLGDRAWWILPSVGFAMLVLYAAWKRQLRTTWVLLAAGMCMALAAFLKVTS